jgi:hypothetical protein
VSDDAGGTAKRLLIERRKRLTATIMGRLEQDAFPHLTQAEQRDLRQFVMTAIGSYHEVAIDLMRTVVGEAEVNELALELLQRIDHNTRSGPRAVAG